MAQPSREDQGPTDVIGTLITLIGKETTFKLIVAAGGTRLFIPTHATVESRITGIIGLSSAEALAIYFGGEYIKVPVARSWQIRVYRERGLSYAQIAHTIGSTETTVARHLKRMGLTCPGRHQSKHTGHAEHRNIMDVPASGHHSIADIRHLEATS